jgi:hypothetical protein
VTVTHLAGHLIRPRAGAGVIEWATATASPAAGGEPGSRAVVRSTDHGVLIAVVDGLGRRRDAAVAAARAATILEAFADAPVRLLLRRCHEELRSTHGAAMTITRLDARASTTDWLGVGNVRAVVAHRNPGSCVRTHIGPCGGVVGYRLPPLRPQRVVLGPSDAMVLATDHIAPGFDEHVDWEKDPQPLADEIISTCGNELGDPLVLVIRYLGIPA